MENEIALFNSSVSTRNGLVGSLAYTSVDGNNFDAVCDALKEAKAFVKKVDKMRLDETRKYDEAKKQVMSAQKRFIKPIQDRIDAVQALADAYVTERERKRMEAEAKAEAERQRAIEAQIAAEQQVAENDPFGLQTPTDAAPAPIVPSVFVPEKTSAASASIAMVTEITVVNPQLVPHQFLVVDERKIRDFVTMKKHEGYKVAEIAIPGVVITERASVRAR